MIQMISGQNGQTVQVHAAVKALGGGVLIKVLWFWIKFVRLIYKLYYIL